MPQTNNGLSAAGSQNAAVTAGGYAGQAPRDASYLYNGTSWTVNNNLITAREWGSAFGTQNDAIYTGGDNGPSVTTTERWNGSTWSTTTSRVTAIARGGVAGGAGSTPATEGGLVFNGDSNPYSTVTEEFTCLNPVNCGLQCLWNSLSYTTT